MAAFSTSMGGNRTKVFSQKKRPWQMAALSRRAGRPKNGKRRSSRGRCHLRRETGPTPILIPGVSGAGDSAVGILALEGVRGRLIEGKNRHSAVNIEQAAADQL
jgi:hypothetical protein